MIQFKTWAFIPLAAAALAAGGCQELVVDNPNHKDIDDLLQDPEGVEILMGTSYNRFVTAIHTVEDVTYFLPALGNETTAQILFGGSFEHTRLPRQAFRNDPTMSNPYDPRGPQELFRRLNVAVANANDGLYAVYNGMEFWSGTAASRVNNTPRARAWAAFVRGMAWGQLGLLFDQAPIFEPGEIVSFDHDVLNPQVLTKLRPYPEVIARAIQSLDEAIAVIDSLSALTPAQTFTTPTLWSRAALGSANMRRAANTYAAKLLVYSARTPAERAQVNWNEVLRRTDTANGVTANFGPTLGSGEASIGSTYWTSLQRNTAGCATCQRLHYDVIGPADVSGAWQAYLATPVEQRSRFDIVTPDRRIVGPSGPQSPGSYVRWRGDDNGFVASRGTDSFSAYQWFRFQGEGRANNVYLVSVDEKNLLRAEAFIRLNQPASAVSLVNTSRTRARTIDGVSFAGLPAVTSTGVPQSATCVPKRASGTCGNLMDALIYERRLELIGTDAARAFADNRGFGLLPEGTPLHFPVPARELQTLGRPIYTYGGIGGNCAVGSPCVVAQP